MTPEEIRSHAICESNDFQIHSANIEFYLREIAAQIAEQNEAIRQDRAIREKLVDEERVRSERRDALLQKAQAGISGVVSTMTPSHPPIEPAGTPVHIACIVKDDERTVLATVDGPIVLSPEDAAHLMALINPAPEGKPQ